MGLFNFDKVANSLREHNEKSKQLKEPVDGAIERYEVIYLGGLPQYPHKKSGSAIGFNIMQESFYFKPTITSEEWFDDMVILYDKVKKFEIKTRQLSISELFMTNDAKGLQTDNNIEITYLDNDNNEIVLRLEMLTGITVAGQAIKCRKMMDILRNNGILSRLNQESVAGNNISSDEMIEQIKKLNELKESGILSDEEFEIKKKEILAKL